jgi:peptidoglycan/xylan/chitin deacetylase (PgdA/CDA1 family)
LVGAAAVAILVAGAAGHVTMSLWVGAVLVATALRPAFRGRLRSMFPVRRPNIAVAWATVSLTLLLTAAVGATSATATWFGAPPVAHGPRKGNNVALTFDTPSADTAVAIASALDTRDLTATFFIAGGGIRSASSFGRAILNRHQLMGNDMYDGNPIQMLDPRAARLTNSQRSFREELGVCPTFFRPSHGYHTPLVERSAHRRGIVMVGWDVSVPDASEKDAATVARDALAHARAGSIIRIDVDRGAASAQSVVDALPAILRGLQQRGLEPVALDQLLHRPAYAARC